MVVKKNVHSLFIIIKIYITQVYWKKNLYHYYILLSLTNLENKQTNRLYSTFYLLKYGLVLCKPCVILSYSTFRVFSKLITVKVLCVLWIRYTFLCIKSLEDMLMKCIFFYCCGTNIITFTSYSCRNIVCQSVQSALKTSKR